MTFRNRQDGLCPRCAWQAEHLIEQIELESLEHDLALITAFEGYCHQRDEAARVPSPLALGEPLFEPRRMQRKPFDLGPLWSKRDQPLPAHGTHRRSA